MATRSKAFKPSASTSKSRSKASKMKSQANSKRKSGDNSDTETTSSNDDEASDAYEESPDEDVKALDSDALDDDSEEEAEITRKRKRGAKSPVKKTSTKQVSPKKRKRKDHSEDEDEDELKDGQEIVGTVVQAPKSGRVPAGQISKNTLNFLNKLKDPKCNDREWFKLHEPVYRQAENEWKDFIDEFTTLLTEVDPQVPPLPPKDVMHRIYRDVRFSNDKTPYKTGFSASFSRSGRKGIFAQYHVQIKAGGESLIAAGSWCPGRNELATIRNNILRNSSRLRDIISSPEFVQHFGEAKPHPKGQRRNIFGRDDELKVAPKGVGKEHRDIDLLKCRSIAVMYNYTDEQVLSPNFKEELARMVKVMQPLVHCLNDYMTLPTGGESDEEESGGDEDEGE